MPLCYNCLQYPVQQHAVQVCSLAITIHTISVCVTFYDVCTMTKSLKDTFLRMHSCCQVTEDSINKPCYFFTNLLPKLKFSDSSLIKHPNLVYFVLSISHKFIVFLKRIKMASFGHFLSFPLSPQKCMKTCI
uniref:Uncharacterized protein n=1 Tax=Myotis myotis TaxID=51298 RepID=A0A7J7VIS7_MYOMY|nr:hypothetical protein mMyoMyo1_008360 [Myotis myotis]